MTKAEELHVEKVAVRMSDDFTHTDHPLQHWDRTCAACVIVSLRVNLAALHDTFTAYRGKAEAELAVANAKLATLAANCVVESRREGK